MYRIPSRLWSTVTTHSCSHSTSGRGRWCVGVRSREPAMGKVWSAIGHPGSVQRVEVSHYFVDLSVAELHGRHENSLFEVIRILNPLVQVLRGVQGGAGGNRGPACQMRQIGPKAAHGCCPGNRVAVGACMRLEHLPPLRDCGILRARLLLILHPSRELLRSIDVHADQHLRVLDAAKLRALTDIETGVHGLNPGLVGMV